jgi:5-methylcytosine-specific restriction endonuclease McrA
MRTDILERKEEILSWIDKELTLFEMKTRLCCKYETLRHYLKQMGIDYAGQQARKGQQKGPKKYIPSSYYTCKNAPPIRSSLLRSKLIRDGVKQDACEICGNTFWQGVHLPLELHHKDGDHFNNELENLQILCPNCHAISAPNAGAAVGTYYERAKAKTAAAAEERKIRAKLSGVLLDSAGHCNGNMLSKEIWQERRELILNSGVDLMKYGWKTKLQEVTGLTRRQVDDTIEHFIDDFKDKIYIRN